MEKHRYAVGKIKQGELHVLGVGKTPKSAWQSARKTNERRTRSIIGDVKEVKVEEVIPRTWYKQIADGVEIFEISERDFEIQDHACKKDLFDFEMKRRLPTERLISVDPTIAAGFANADREAGLAS